MRSFSLAIEMGRGIYVGSADILARSTISSDEFPMVRRIMVRFSSFSIRSPLRLRFCSRWSCRCNSCSSRAAAPKLPGGHGQLGLRGGSLAIQARQGSSLTVQVRR